MPFLGAAYSRACERTCDRWGAALCGDPAGALRGLAILAAGGSHARSMNLQAFVAQRRDLDTGWMTLGSWLSAYPPLSERVELLAPALGAGLPANAQGPQRAAGILALLIVVPALGFAAVGAVWVMAVSKFAGAGSGLAALESSLSTEATPQITDPVAVNAARLQVASDLEAIAAVLREHHAATGRRPEYDSEIATLWARYRGDLALPLDPFSGRGLQLGDDRRVLGPSLLGRPRRRNGDRRRHRLSTRARRGAGVLRRLLLLALAMTLGCAALRPATTAAAHGRSRARARRQTRGTAAVWRCSCPAGWTSRSSSRAPVSPRAVASRGLASTSSRSIPHLGYFRARSVVERLRTDVIAPARAAGYDTIWIVGTSLGGLGGLLYLRDHPEDLAGVLAIAPYLGETEVIDEIERAGGPARWQPPPTIAESDVGRELWSWLATWPGDGPPVPLHLGWGAADDFDRSNRLLAGLLPPERVYTVAGGHDWRVWERLWEEFLDRTPAVRRARLSAVRLALLARRLPQTVDELRLGLRGEIARPSPRRRRRAPGAARPPAGRRVRAD